ncbi:MAG: MgtC/SapB family protein, partial [Rhodospirillales bacterium]
MREIRPSLIHDKDRRGVFRYTSAMEDIDLYQRLGLALGIGLLIGIERGWQFRTEVEGGRIAGARTFTLIGLLGGVWGVLALNVHVAILGAAFLGFSALLVTAYIFNLRHSAKPDLGITTEVATLLTFALGALAVLGDMILAAAAAVVTVAVLDIKARMHGWIETITKYELDAAIKLLLISVVLLPLLPDKGFGPGQVLNPFTIWWMVVLIASLSFLG